MRKHPGGFRTVPISRPLMRQALGRLIDVGELLSEPGGQYVSQRAGDTGAGMRRAGKR